MENEVDIDKRICECMWLDDAYEFDIDSLNSDEKRTIDSLKSLIREVAEECIGEDMPEGNSFNIGQKMHNKVKAEQRTKLNKILGKEEL